MSEHTGGRSIRTKCFSSLPSWLTQQSETNLGPLPSLTEQSTHHHSEVVLKISSRYVCLSGVYKMDSPCFYSPSASRNISHFNLHFLIIICNILAYFCLWFPFPKYRFEPSCLNIIMQVLTTSQSSDY